MFSWLKMGLYESHLHPRKGTRLGVSVPEVLARMGTWNGDF